jgi:mono/diheme cytochrome c family protein
MGTASSQQGRTFRKFLLFCVLGLIVLVVALAAFHKTPWIVPETEKARRNPLTAVDVNIAVARQIYDDKCINCHGDTGKGDGSEAMMHDPRPADLTDAVRMSKATDGEIFYQISEGHKPMPAFKNKLTPDQRWQLVLLVRSFAAPAPAQLPADPSAGQKK